MFLSFLVPFIGPHSSPQISPSLEVKNVIHVEKDWSKMAEIEKNISLIVKS